MRLPSEAEMNNGHLEVISLVERLHRHFLEVVKLELDGLGIHDINNVQGLMLFNIGDAEMTVGELTLRGCYLGSNVSYNVKKMVENGYLSQERSVHGPGSTASGSARATSCSVPANTRRLDRQSSSSGFDATATGCNSAARFAVRSL